MTTTSSIVRIFVALCLVCSVAGAAGSASTVGDVPGQLPRTIDSSTGAPPIHIPDPPAGDPCETTTGDVNLDGSVNITDAVALNNFLMCETELTPEQRIQSDVNGDCVVDLDDSWYIVDFVFNGGPEPVPCLCEEKEDPPCHCYETGDVNQDGDVNIADAVMLNNFLKCEVTPTDEQLIRSDVDGNCVVDLDDSWYIVDLVFNGGPEPVPCLCVEKEFLPYDCRSTGDVNQDGNVNIADAVMLNNFLQCEAIPTDDQLIQSDVNGDCVVDLDDFWFIVDLVFNGGPEPVPCLCVEKELWPCECRSTGDVNQDGNVNIADAVMLNNFLQCEITLTDDQLIQSDVNGDCIVDMADSEYIVDLVFHGGDEPVPCRCAEKEVPNCE